MPASFALTPRAAPAGAPEPRVTIGLLSFVASKLSVKLAATSSFCESNSIETVTCEPGAAFVETTRIVRPVTFVLFGMIDEAALFALVCPV